MYDPYAAFEKRTFDNGLDVWVFCDPGKDFEYVAAMVHSGTWNDPDSHVGLAHFTEHMVCANDRLNSSEADNLYEREGAKWDAFTSTCNTHYRFVAPIDAPSFGDYLSHMKRLCFDNSLKNNLERERSVILREHDKDLVSEKQHQLAVSAHRNTYIGTPHARCRTALGTREGIRSISLEDVQRFRYEAYVPANMSIVCVGGLTIDEVLIKLRAAGFERVHERSVGSGRIRSHFAPLSCFESPSERRFVLQRDSASGGEEPQCTLQQEVMISGGVSTESIVVCSKILGELLYNELREERHLTYATGSDANQLGMFNDISLTVKAFAERYLEDVEKLISELVASIPDRYDLFEKHKHARMMSHQVCDVSLESIFDIAVEEIARLGHPVTLKSLRDSAADVRFSEVKQIAWELGGTRTVTRVLYH